QPPRRGPAARPGAARSLVLERPGRVWRAPSAAVERLLRLALLVTLSSFAAPSEVIFPAQQLPVNFSHAKHLAKKIDCDFCHERVGTSTKSADNLLPTKDVCETCHPAKTGMGADLVRAVIPPPNIK